MRVDRYFWGVACGACMLWALPDAAEEFQRYMAARSKSADPANHQDFGANVVENYRRFVTSKNRHQDIESRFRIDRIGKYVRVLDEQKGLVSVVGPKHIFELTRERADSPWILKSILPADRTLLEKGWEGYFSGSERPDESPDVVKVKRIYGEAFGRVLVPYSISFSEEEQSVLVEGTVESVERDGKSLRRLNHTLQKKDGDWGVTGYYLLDPEYPDRFVEYDSLSSTGKTKVERSLVFSPGGRDFVHKFRRAVTENGVVSSDVTIGLTVTFLDGSAPLEQFELAHYGIQMQEETVAPNRTWILLVAVGVVGLVAGLYLKARQV